MKPVVDVVIVDYQMPDYTEHAAETVRERFGVEHSLTVVDAHRDDLSYAAAINQGMKGGSAPFLLALNADTACLGDQSPIVDLLGQNPSIGVIGPRQHDSSADQRITHAGIFGPEPHCVHRAWQQPLRNVDPDTRELMLDVHTVSGAVYYMRRDVFEDCDGWDERLRFFYEDTLHSLRTAARGYRVIYCGLPQTTWVHEWCRSPVDPSWRAERARESREKFWRICAAEGLPGGQPAEYEAVV